MNILIIPVVTPFPLDNGGAVAQFAVLEYLQDKCDITVCCRAYSVCDIQNNEQLKKKLPKVKFEIIYLIEGNNLNLIHTPTSKKSIKKKIVGFLKMINRKFEKQTKDNNPIFLNSKISRDEFKNSSRINPVVLHSESFINQLADIIRSQKWDIIQTEFYEMLELVSLFPVKCKKVFVNHESRTLRLESAKTLSKSSEEYCNYIISVNKLYETEFLKKYDSVIVFSNEDKIRLNNFGVLNIEVSAFPVLSSDFIDKSPFQKLKQLVFIGGASHYPNKEGLTWFVEKVYPAIYEKYKLPLVVIGSWNEDAKVHPIVGEVSYKGFVENLYHEVQDSVQIVPVRIGNGIRTKILMGMAMKMPIITTALGVEGIEVGDNREIFIADTLEEYIEKILYILQNEKDIQNILEDAYSFVKNNYSQEKVGETRLKIYNQLIYD